MSRRSWRKSAIHFFQGKLLIEELSHEWPSSAHFLTTKHFTNTLAYLN